VSSLGCLHQKKLIPASPSLLYQLILSAPRCIQHHYYKKYSKQLSATRE